MPKVLKKNNKKDCPPQSEGAVAKKEARLLNDCEQWWAVTYWLWKYSTLWKTSKSFRFGITFMCAENMLAAMAHVSDGMHFCDTAISRSIAMSS
ncbi:hypothetical protein TKK_0012223 [Trichogramma kaykai]